MYKTSFYPGPSRVYSNIPEYIYDAYREGILSTNHRSEQFHELMTSLQKQLRLRLKIPKSYELAFCSSATECWEVIAQSLTRDSSHHLYNGAFGQKWFSYAKRLNSGSTGHSFHLDEIPAHDMPELVQAEMICITQNETSNGTQLPTNFLQDLRKGHKDALIAVDATSSMAGIMLDFSLADIWFASVQKCFGLPAGLAVMILSKKAISRAKDLGDSKYYNSLNFMLEHFGKAEAPFTPNVMNLYLLLRVMKRSKDIQEVDKKIRDRSKTLYDVFSGLEDFQPMVKNPLVRSDTVLAIEGNAEKINKLKSDAASLGIILGNGYGEYKDSTFRVANFPAIKSKEVESLHKFFRKNYD